MSLPVWVAAWCSWAVLGMPGLAASALQPLLGFTPFSLFPSHLLCLPRERKDTYGIYSLCLRILIYKDPFFQTRSHTPAPHGSGCGLVSWRPASPYCGRHPPVASTEAVCLVYSFLVLLCLFCIYVSVVESESPSSVDLSSW